MAHAPGKRCHTFRVTYRETGSLLTHLFHFHRIVLVCVCGGEDGASNDMVCWHFSREGEQCLLLVVTQESVSIPRTRQGGSEIRLWVGWGSLSSRGRALGGLPVKVGIKRSGRRLCGDSQEGRQEPTWNWAEDAWTDCFK